MPKGTMGRSVFKASGVKESRAGGAIGTSKQFGGETYDTGKMQEMSAKVANSARKRGEPAKNFRIFK